MGIKKSEFLLLNLFLVASLKCSLLNLSDFRSVNLPTNGVHLAEMSCLVALGVYFAFFLSGYARRENPQPRHLPEDGK